MLYLLSYTHRAASSGPRLEDTGEVERRPSYPLGAAAPNRPTTAQPVCRAAIVRRVAESSPGAAWNTASR